MNQVLASTTSAFFGASLALLGAHSLGWHDRAPLEVHASDGTALEGDATESLVLHGAGEARVVLGFQDEEKAVPGVWSYDRDGRLRAELSYDAGDETPHEVTTRCFVRGRPCVPQKDVVRFHGAVHGGGVVGCLTPGGIPPKLVILCDSSGAKKWTPPHFAPRRLQQYHLASGPIHNST